ncbi:MAG: family 43 glycosylhydrolase, partial [Candidatus Eisenbacteria bacterium]
MPPHRARTALLTLIVGLGFQIVSLVAPGPSRAQVAPVSPARYLPPPGYRTKEFTLVRDEGWFHVFYLRENEIPGVPTQLSFGHAISRDLYTWAEQDTILPIVPGTFEGTQMWAPSLHRIDGLWFLFYPGMRDDPGSGYRLAQTISYATSPDLYTWTRRGTPLFDNTIFPWAYVDPTSVSGSDCRDPFVFWDAARAEWLMYVSTRPASRPQSMVIGIAGSTDLETWSDRGQMPLSLPNVSFSDVAESPHVFSRDDSLHLILWTTDAGQSLTFGRSTDPVTGWNTSRRLRSMLGYSTLGWWASEMMKDGERSYFGVVHDRWLDFWDATWTAPDTFVLTPPDSLQLLGARLMPDRAAPGDTVALEVVAVNAAGRRAALTLTRREGGVSGPLLPADFGLPDSLALVGDTTRFAWVVPTTSMGSSF